MHRLLTLGLSTLALLAVAACAAERPYGGDHVTPPSGAAELGTGAGSGDTARTSDFLTGRSRSGPIGSNAPGDIGVMAPDEPLER